MEGSDGTNTAKWFSLSPRERVGVRGKEAMAIRALQKLRFAPQPHLSNSTLTVNLSP
jgi:hypothetical protein